MNDQQSDQQKPAKRGRPPTNPVDRHKTVTFSFPPDMILWINGEAQRRGLKRSVFMRQLVTAEMGRQETAGAE